MWQIDANCWINLLLILLNRQGIRNLPCTSSPIPILFFSSLKCGYMFDHVCIYYIWWHVYHMYNWLCLYIIYINHVCLDIVLFLSRHKTQWFFRYLPILGMAHVWLTLIDATKREILLTSWSMFEPIRPPWLVKIWTIVLVTLCGPWECGFVMFCPCFSRCGCFKIAPYCMPSIHYSSDSSGTASRYS